MKDLGGPVPVGRFQLPACLQIWKEPSKPSLDLQLCRRAGPHDLAYFRCPVHEVQAYLGRWAIRGRVDGRHLHPAEKST